MKSTMKRTLGLAAATGGLLIGGVLAATPAHAGGEVRVVEDTKAACNAVLEAKMDDYRDAGYRITDVTPCNYIGSGSYGGSFGVTSA